MQNKRSTFAILFYLNTSKRKNQEIALSWGVSVWTVKVRLSARV